MMEFLRMGGEAAYVWSAYGITLAVVLLNVWWARWTHQHALERARASSTEARASKKPTVRQVE
jgi:heme exporter protein CcmD